MDPTQQQSTSWQTLASVLAGGLQGYVDAQNNQPVAVVAPSPATAYGPAGLTQATPGSIAGSLSTGNPLLLFLIVAGGIYILARK